MSKRYKLLKDLPNVNEGTVIVGMSFGDYSCSDKFGGLANFKSKLVETNPEWFELIPDTPEPKQTTKEGFVWTDELVHDFFSILPRYFSQGHSSNSAMNQFKASKQSQSNTPKEDKLYTQSDLDKAVEDAFGKARAKWLFAPFNYIYESHEDYLSSKKK